MRYCSLCSETMQRGIVFSKSVRSTCASAIFFRSGASWGDTERKWLASFAACAGVRLPAGTSINAAMSAGVSAFGARTGFGAVVALMRNFPSVCRSPYFCRNSNTTVFSPVSGSASSK